MRQDCESRAAHTKPACVISFPYYPCFIWKLGCFIWCFSLAETAHLSLSPYVANHPMEFRERKLTVWKVTNSNNTNYFRHQREWFLPPTLGQSVWICVIFTACIPASSRQMTKWCKAQQKYYICIRYNQNLQFLPPVVLVTFSCLWDIRRHLLKPQPGFSVPVFFHFTI